MPPRKKRNSAAADKPLEATRRSTRAKKPVSGPTVSSSDELASQRQAPREISERSEAENSQQDVADEITVRTTRSQSPSSRPSTANGASASQSQRQKVAVTPVRKEDVDMPDASNDEEDELAGEAPASKKIKPIIIKQINKSPATARKGKSKYDNPDEMLTNPRAPLATAKLRDLLCSSRAWDALTPAEQQQILAKFPDDKEVADAGTARARPDVAALRNNDNFRHDAAQYQTNLAKGWHDPEWIHQAQAAHRKREIGAYAEYLAARFRDDWGVEMPPRGWEDGEDLNQDSDAMEGVEQSTSTRENGEAQHRGRKRSVQAGRGIPPEARGPEHLSASEDGSAQ